jgi:hypothetical protein
VQSDLSVTTEAQEAARERFGSHALGDEGLFGQIYLVTVVAVIVRNLIPRRFR